ncbi:MAG: TIGR03435 family protein [Acidobacteriia bacterium]|nr:TIGR03435 family protein [Terriglobia bacterium]
MKSRLLIIALLAAVGLGQSPDADSSFRPAFEVASVKPDPGGTLSVGKPPGGGFWARGIWTKLLIGLAYDVKEFQILAGPSWISHELYSIDAKRGDNPRGAILSPPQLIKQRIEDEEWHLRIQSLLADRFQLRIHRETKEQPVYSLVVGKNGPKFRESRFSEADFRKGAVPGLTMRPYELIGNSVAIRFLADELSRRLDRNVIDRTGLNEEYNFDLRWVQDMVDGHSVPDGPSIFTAVQEQLGLKLESGKAPVDAITIDHIEKPSPN